MIDNKSIEVRRGWKSYYLFWTLVWAGIIGLTFIIPSQRQDSIDFFFKNWSLLKFGVIIALLSVPIVCLYNYFDKRIKLKVDEIGVWTKKYGTISWDEIWYFNTTFTKMKEGDMYCFKIKLKDTAASIDEEHKIKFRHMDQEFETVRKIISFYAGKHKINDLGHEQKA